MATVKFYIKNPKKNGQLRNDEVSIYAVFTIDRDSRFPVSTDEKIQPKHWDSVTQTVKPSGYDHVNINLALADKKSELLRLWRENKHLPFEQFKALARGKNESVEKKTLFQTYKSFLEDCWELKDEKTAKKYEALLTHLEQFNPKLDFEHIDHSFYDNFKKYLYKQPNNRGGNLIDSTVNKYFTNFKTFLIWCGKRGAEVEQHFRDWEIKSRKTEVIALTLSELQRLEQTIISEPNIALGRDYLCLESRTGQRISDLLAFDHRQIMDRRWVFDQKKGNRESLKRVTVHFIGYCAPAYDILKKYNFNLPKLSEQKIRQNIKKACKKAGIDTYTRKVRWSGNKQIVQEGPKWKFISSHTGRKTFITLGLQFMNPKVVKDLAQVSWSTIRHYEAYSEEGIIENQLLEMERKIKAI